MTASPQMRSPSPIGWQKQRTGDRWVRESILSLWTKIISLSPRKPAKVDGMLPYHSDTLGKGGSGRLQCVFQVMTGMAFRAHRAVGLWSLLPFLPITPQQWEKEGAGKPRGPRQPTSFPGPPQSSPQSQPRVTQRRLSPGSAHSPHSGSLPSSPLPPGPGSNTGSLSPSQGTMTTL